MYNKLLVLAISLISSTSLMAADLSDEEKFAVQLGRWSSNAAAGGVEMRHPVYEGGRYLPKDTKDAIKIARPHYYQPLIIDLRVNMDAGVLEKHGPFKLTCKTTDPITKPHMFRRNPLAAQIGLERRSIDSKKLLPCSWSSPEEILEDNPSILDLFAGGEIIINEPSETEEGKVEFSTLCEPLVFYMPVDAKIATSYFFKFTDRNGMTYTHRFLPQHFNHQKQPLVGPVTNIEMRRSMNDLNNDEHDVVTVNYHCHPLETTNHGENIYKIDLSTARWQPLA